MRRDRPTRPQPSYSDAELEAMQAERNYWNSRAMMLHYARLAHAWRYAMLQTRDRHPNPSPLDMENIYDLSA